MNDFKENLPWNWRNLKKSGQKMRNWRYLASFSHLLSLIEGNHEEDSGFWKDYRPFCQFLRDYCPYWDKYQKKTFYVLIAKISYFIAILMIKYDIFYFRNIVNCMYFINNLPRFVIKNYKKEDKYLKNEIFTEFLCFYEAFRENPFIKLVFCPENLNWFVEFLIKSLSIQWKITRNPINNYFFLEFHAEKLSIYLYNWKKINLMEKNVKKPYRKHEDKAYWEIPLKDADFR